MGNTWRDGAPKSLPKCHSVHCRTLRHCQQLCAKPGAIGGTTAAGLMRALACALFCLAWALPGAVASIQDRGTTAPGSPAAAGAAPAPAPAGAHPPHSQAEREAGLRQLFQAIDANADGQLDALETASYASAALDLREEGWSPDAAARHSQEALDSADAGATVSKAEVQAHLHALMQASLELHSANAWRC